MKSTLLLGTVCLLAIGWLSCMNPPTTPQEQTSPNDTAPTDTAGYQQWVEYIASQKALLPRTEDNAIDMRVWGKHACNDKLFDSLTKQFNSAIDGGDIFWQDVNNLMILFYGVNYRDDNVQYLDLEREFDTNFRKGNKGKAFQIAQEILKFAPASPHILDLTGFLQFMLDSTAYEAIQSYHVRTTLCLYAMEMLGDGSQESPLIITNVSDEYFYLARRLKVRQIANQQLVTNPITGAQCDVLTLTEEDAKRLGIDAVWFDVTYSMRRMEKLFNLSSDANQMNDRSEGATKPSTKRPQKRQAKK